MTTVLLVDDDAVFRGLARHMLVVADAGDLHPEAALVDVMLAGGDGVALAHELAELPWRPRVLLTSTAPARCARSKSGGSTCLRFPQIGTKLRPEQLGEETAVAIESSRDPWWLSPRACIATRPKVPTGSVSLQRESATQGVAGRLVRLPLCCLDSRAR